MFASMFRKCSGYGITWKVILTFLFPVLFLPLPLLWAGSVSRCLYVLSLMGSYWSVSSSLLSISSHTPTSGYWSWCQYLPPLSSPWCSFPYWASWPQLRSIWNNTKTIIQYNSLHLGECLLPQVILHVIHGGAHGGHCYRALQSAQVSHEH